MTELTLRQSVDAAARGDAASAPPTVRSIPGPSSAVQFALVTDRASFDALEGEWTELTQKHARPEQVFQTFAWCWHWANHYVSADRDGRPRLCIVTGRSEGRLVLIMPLVTERRVGMTELRWLGEPVSQYFDVVAAPEAQNEATLAAAWQFAVSATRADVANLRKVRADALVSGLLAAIGARVTASEEAPFIPFFRWPCFADYDATLSSKARKNRRRQRRRLEEHGEIIHRIDCETEDAASLAAMAIELKREWLRDKDRISLALTDDRFAAFFSDVAHGRGRPVGVKVLSLRAGQDIAALQIAIDHKRSRFLHLAVYRPEFEKCAAGSLLLEDNLAAVQADGIAIFDFLAPRHAYKMEFTDVTVPVYDHALAMSLKGRLWAEHVLPMRSRLKLMVENGPAPVRRVLAKIL